MLVMSHEVFNARSGTVVALAISSQPQRAGFPLTLRIKSIRLPKPSWIKIGQIRTLSTERLGRKMGALSPEEISQVTEGLSELVG